MCCLLCLFVSCLCFFVFVCLCVFVCVCVLVCVHCIPKGSEHALSLSDLLFFPGVARVGPEASLLATRASYFSDCPVGYSQTHDSGLATLWVEKRPFGAASLFEPAAAGRHVTLVVQHCPLCQVGCSTCEPLARLGGATGSLVGLESLTLELETVEPLARN